VRIGSSVIADRTHNAGARPDDNLAHSDRAGAVEKEMTMNRWGDRAVAVTLIFALGWLAGAWCVDYGIRMKQASYYAKCASDQDPTVNVRTTAVICRPRPAAAR
jgi:hypothetical protein